MIRIWLLVAGLGGAASVIAGAFAAHLAGEPKTAELLRTGAFYGIVHATALVAIGALVEGQAPRPVATIAGWSFALGLVLFSFSLFALAAASGGARWLGWVTPFGGIAFVIGWLAVAALALPRRR
jgi:uncharacterized membrane protein YgdD (TMEM256/DUF423 family)